MYVFFCSLNTSFAFSNSLTKLEQCNKYFEKIYSIHSFTFWLQSIKVNELNMCRDSIKIYLSSIENISVTLGKRVSYEYESSIERNTTATTLTHTHTLLHSWCTNIDAEIVWEIKKAKAEKHYSRRNRYAVKKGKQIHKIFAESFKSSEATS